MNKKHFLSIAIAFPVVAIGVGSILFTSVSAQDDPQGTTFIEKLSLKLGIDQSTVQSAVDGVRDEMHDEREAQMTEEINTLVSEGKITQRQSDLINATHDIREELRGSSEKPNHEEMQNLTHEERQSKMEEMRTQMDNDMVAKLNEKGFNTTLEELQSTHEVMKDNGIMGPMKGRGPKMGF